MALPSSGEISMADVYEELTGTAPSVNQNYTLSDLCDGTIAALNTAGPNQPTTTPPYRLTSWYGYDHNYSAGSAPSASFTITIDGGVLYRTDKKIRLLDTSSGGTNRGWQITGGGYTVIVGSLGNYTTGQGGTTIVELYLDDPDTSYTFTIKAYNSNGTDTLANIVSTTPYLLEEYGGSTMKQAFSIRKINADITYCMRIRRSSNNDEQDIGFTADGDLDTAAILSFASGTDDAYVVTWYDQSGNGADVTNSTQLNQPRISWNGAIEEDGAGNVAIRFASGSNNRLRGSTGAGTLGLTGSVNRTDYLLACEITQAYNGLGINIAGTTPNSYTNGQLWRVTHEAGNRVYGGNRLWETAATSFASQSVKLGVCKLDGTSTANMSFYYGGGNTAVTPTATNTRTMNIPSTAYTFFGNDHLGTSYLNGYVSEYLVYATAHNDTTRGLIEDDILAYYAGI